MEVEAEPGGCGMSIMGQGVTGARISILILIWWLSMGMTNYIDASTGVFNYRVAPRYNVTEIGSWVGLDSEEATMTDAMEPRANPEEADSFGFLDTFVFLYKAGIFVASTLYSSTFGFHVFLYNAFGIPYLPWGVPLMILILLLQILGIYEIWTSRKI